MAMRALLLVVFAVAGGVAGWQLRGLAADSAGAVAMPIASRQKQPRPAPVLSRQPPPEPAVLNSDKTIDSSPLALVAGDALEVLYEELAGADLTREESIRTQILQYVSEHRAQLIEQQRWTELLEFYQRLVSLDPHFSEHYYRLAEVQVRLQLFDQALYSLYFILQDSVMGARARAGREYQLAFAVYQGGNGATAQTRHSSCSRGAFAVRSAAAVVGHGRFDYNTHAKCCTPSES